MAQVIYSCRNAFAWGINSIAISINWRKKKMALMKILKGSGPNVDPCGTPADILAHSLKDLFILQRGSLFVR